MENADSEFNEYFKGALIFFFQNIWKIQIVGFIIFNLKVLYHIFTVASVL